MVREDDTKTCLRAIEKAEFALIARSLLALFLLTTIANLQKQASQ